eukprot:scaffold8624_cov30-Tisochrysis_lutea.AAC.3
MLAPRQSSEATARVGTCCRRRHRRGVRQWMPGPSLAPLVSGLRRRSRLNTAQSPCHYKS